MGGGLAAADRAAAFALAWRPALESAALTSLRVSQCALSDGAIVLLTGALRRAPALATLDVSLNAFGEGGALALADFVAAAPSLTALDLSGNPLADRHALVALTALSEAVGASTTLKSLEWAGLGRAGALTPRGRAQWAALAASAITDRRALEVVDLSGQPFGGDAAGASVEAAAARARARASRSAWRCARAGRCTRCASTAAASPTAASPPSSAR